MSITFNSTEIRINSGTYTFDEIYNEAVSQNKTQYISKLGNFYEIKNDFRIRNGGSVIDGYVSVVINGDLVQIEKGGLLQLGNIDSNGVITGNSFISAPNIKLAYGFGCTTKTNSGDIKIYGSIINIYGYWGFFEGTNTVELIENKIDGFGRISGSNSIFKNNLIKKAHGQYGTFATYGNIAIDIGTEVYSSEQTSNGWKVAAYCNPEYSGNMVVRSGIYDGYEKLCYIESTSGGDTLTFIDSDVRNGYLMERESNNVDFYHKFTFNPVIVNSSGTTLSNADIVVKDNMGNVVVTATTDSNGNIYEEITYFKSDRNDDETYYTPHTIVMTHNDITTEVVIRIDRPLIGIPLCIIDSGSGSGTSTDIDYNRIQAMITESTNTMCDCSDSVKTEVIDGNQNINQVLIALGENVSENQAIIEGKNGSRMIL